MADPNHTPILYPIHNLNLVLNPIHNRKPNPLPNFGNLTLYVTLYQLTNKILQFIISKVFNFQEFSKKSG